MIMLMYVVCVCAFQG